MANRSMTTRAEREIAELEGVFRALAHHVRRHIMIVVEAFVELEATP